MTSTPQNPAQRLRLSQILDHPFMSEHPLRQRAPQSKSKVSFLLNLESTFTCGLFLLRVVSIPLPPWTVAMLQCHPMRPHPMARDHLGQQLDREGSPHPHHQRMEEVGTVLLTHHKEGKGVSKPSKILVRFCSSPYAESHMSLLRNASLIPPTPKVA